MRSKTEQGEGGELIFFRETTQTYMVEIHNKELLSLSDERNLCSFFSKKKFPYERLQKFLKVKLTRDNFRFMSFEEKTWRK